MSKRRRFPRVEAWTFVTHVVAVVAAFVVLHVPAWGLAMVVVPAIFVLGLPWSAFFGSAANWGLLLFAGAPLVNLVLHGVVRAHRSGGGVASRA